MLLKKRFRPFLAFFCLQDVKREVKMLECVAHTTELLTFDSDNAEVVRDRKKAQDLGSSHSAFHLWKSRRRGMNYRGSSRFVQLESVRELRAIVEQGGCVPARFKLCKLYAQGLTGDRSEAHASQVVRNLFAQSKPFQVKQAFQEERYTSFMRSVYCCNTST